MFIEAERSICLAVAFNQTTSRHQMSVLQLCVDCHIFIVADMSDLAIIITFLAHNCAIISRLGSFYIDANLAFRASSGVLKD
ncbi:hypothetical protein BCR37DRAFT_381839 [Protomyces lactucae-debilis]|uniref:Uncharacterized protein n=1 Tax=Protomyces lactucae-debilis TaxID=2754530 RepID=A0A1Y2F518_PROLT|nr:uncharacterized protein BCR37DRAFT_381839 [Protomyces lactucae-debilis]ORY78972.1 hypothetical protein BCR37DRAFT_381839 [Protomyces lactucae-debilis]